MDKAVVAAFRAATAQPDYLTTDKFDAMLSGFGVFNLGIWAAANVLAKEIEKGRKIKLDVANEQHTDMDFLAGRLTKVLKECGADPSNASLVAATLLYWAGANVTAGIPAPNRKLGAVCRMAAGAPAGRVANMPTEKLNNKISGFAAVQAMYQAMSREILAPYDGASVPLGVGGSPLTGHTRLGEDILFPELAQKLVRIGVDAMLQAYRSVGIKPSRWMAGLLSCAAALEILHPDAYVGDEWGPFLQTRTHYVCGLTAVEAAKLPDKIHIRGTGEELETAKVLGELAMILKDCGAPTVVGMIMFNEANAIIAEGAGLGVGRSGGPLLLPLTHWCTSAVLALYLISKGMSESGIVDTIAKTMDNFFQPEHAAVATNLLARRGNFLERGPVTRMVIQATEPTLVKAVYRRALRTHEALRQGRTLTEVTRSFEEERIQTIGEGVARIMSQSLGRKIEYVKFRNVRAGAGRRTHRFAKQYFAFDGYVDVDVKVDGKVHRHRNIYVTVIPDAMVNKDQATLDIVQCYAVGAVDLLNAGAVAMDVVVPACVGAAMGMEVSEALEQAAAGATISMSIQVPTMQESATLAARIAREMPDDFPL